MKRRDFVRSSLSLAALWPAGALLPRMVLAATEPTTDLPAVTLSGDATTLLRAEVAELGSALRGTLLLPGQSGYDEARKVWNGMFDKRPALIARCAAPTDVMLAVTFAREHRLLTAVRGGGHSFSGKSTCEGGIVIDLSPMRGVRVEPARRLARIEGGALQGFLDREASAFGLVTTTGTVSHTGAAGLTLGGGFGRVARRFGLSCDNLHAIDVVTADGRLVTANERDNAELFWGVRGGGGNFGVATSFEYRLHPMDPMVLAGNIVWPFEQAREVLRFYADFSMQAPDELNLDLVLRGMPDGNRIIAVQACWSADHAAGAAALQSLRSFGRPASDTIAPLSYVELQASGDAGSAPGTRRYVKSGFFANLDPAIDAILEAFRSAEAGTIGFSMQHAGGAISRTAPDATAFANRDVRYWANCSTKSLAATEDESRIAVVRRAWKIVEPHTSGFYVNAMSEDLQSKVDVNYGRNYARLVELKNKYDPGNLFRLNANIKPAG